MGTVAPQGGDGSDHMDPFSAWFRRSVEDGIDAERLIARDLLIEGFAAWHPVPGYVEGFAPGDYRAVEPDLMASPDRVLWFGLEVKSKRRAVFTGPQDFPYPMAFIGSVDSWRNRTTNPDYIVVYSVITGGRFVIPVYTADLWTQTWTGESPIMAAPRECFRTWEWLIRRLRDA